MATTKKSSKAKTNTTKAKTAAANARRRSAPKSAKAKAPVKTAAAKAKKAPAKTVKAVTTKKPTGAQTVYARLRQLNMVSALLHVVGAIAAAVLMGTASVQVFTGLMVKDELASNASTVFVPAIHHLYDLEVRWLVVGILLLGAVVPLLNVFREARYNVAVKAKNVPLRWADKALLSGAMLGVVAVLSGVQDFATLKVVGGLIVITAVLGWLAERQNADAKAKPDRSAYVVSLLSGALPWLIILAFAFGTLLWGMVRYPWYVYALYAAVFIGSAAYAINGYNYVRRFRNWTKYELVERNYIIIDIVARVSFAAILIVGLAK